MLAQNGHKTCFIFKLSPKFDEKPQLSVIDQSVEAILLNRIKAITKRTQRETKTRLFVWGSTHMTH